MTDLEALNLLIATGDKVTSARLDYLQQTLGVNKLFLSEEFNQLKKGLRYLRDNSFDPATADLSEFLNESADPFVRESGQHLVWNYYDKNRIQHSNTSGLTIIKSIELPEQFLNKGYLEVVVFARKLGSTVLCSNNLYFSTSQEILGYKFSTNTSGTTSTLLNLSVAKTIFFEGNEIVHTSGTIEGAIPQSKINFAGGNNFTVIRNSNFNIKVNNILNIVFDTSGATETMLLEAVNIKIYN